MIVVAGASGFVGRHLVDRLVAEGREVRGATRDPEAAAQRSRAIPWARFDVEREEGLDEALQGARALVYLVHQLSAGRTGLHGREEEAAARVLAACERAGVARIVYLGGPRPAGPPSAHLRARLRTGEILRSGRPSCIELRAAMIVGAGSASWTLCRDLALRLPVMVLPRWLETRSQPVGVDDVAAALAHAIDDPLDGSAWFDLPGPEVLSARQILERIAAIAGTRPVMMPVPLLTPWLSSWWLRLVTRADWPVARQLVDGLRSDLVARDDGYWARMPGYRRTPFDEAVRRALAEDTPPDAVGRTWEALAHRVARHALPAH